MIDIPASSVEFAALPDAPAGMKVSHVDVVIRVRKAQG
jgi:Fur family iron response transcriptional regulator